MFGVSFPELAVVFFVALLVFGPDKLPELARTIGKISAQLRRQSDSVRREFYNTVYKPADDFRASIDREARSLMSESVSQQSQSQTSQHAAANPPPTPPDITKKEE